MSATKHPVCLLVTIKCNPGQRDTFVKRVSDHAEICLREEPGCLHFNVIVPPRDHETVYLYEVYVDEQAIEFHLGTERMQQYMSDVEPMLADRHREVCEVVNWVGR